MKRASKITRRKMTQEELDELERLRPILSPKEAMVAEMQEMIVNRFMQDLSAKLAEIVLDRSGPY